MKGRNDRQSQGAEEARPASAEVAPRDVIEDVSTEPTAVEAKSSLSSVPVYQSLGPTQPDIAPRPAEAAPPSHRLRKWLLLAGTVAGLCAGGYFLKPWVLTALNTVSTDDAYVNGHVTFVAPRVAGQVSKVLVDDNYRVKKGDVLVELDSEPYRVQVAIKKAAVEAAETDLAAAQAQVRGQVAQARANRYKLEHAIEDVDNQIANLHASVATLNSRKATLQLAQANLTRGEKLFASRTISQEDFDLLKESFTVAEAGVEQALQAVYAIRVSLGLPAAAAPGPRPDRSAARSGPELLRPFGRRWEN